LEKSAKCIIGLLSAKSRAAYSVTGDVTECDCLHSACAAGAPRAVTQEASTVVAADWTAAVRVGPRGLGVIISSVRQIVQDLVSTLPHQVSDVRHSSMHGAI